MPKNMQKNCRYCLFFLSMVIHIIGKQLSLSCCRSRKRGGRQRRRSSIFFLALLHQIQYESILLVVLHVFGLVEQNDGGQAGLVGGVHPQRTFATRYVDLFAMGKPDQTILMVFITFVLLPMCRLMLKTEIGRCIPLSEEPTTRNPCSCVGREEQMTSQDPDNWIGKVVVW